MQTEWPALAAQRRSCDLPCHTPTSRRTGERRPSVAGRHNQPTIHMLSASVRSLFSGSKGTGRRIAILSPVAATTKLKPQANDRQHGFRLRGNPIPFRFHHRYRDSSKSISCTSLRDVSSLISWWRSRLMISARSPRRAARRRARSAASALRNRRASVSSRVRSCMWGW